MLIAPVNEEAQKRLTVTAGTESGKAGGERAPPGDVAHSFMGDVHTAAGDVLDRVQRHADLSHAPTIVRPKSSSVRMCDRAPP